MSVTAVVGTQKGAFVLRGDADRERWTVSGPLFKGWKVTAALKTAAGKVILATASDVYGAALHQADSVDGKFTQIADGPRYEDGGPRKLEQIWRIAESGGRLWCGVAEAGLFTSDDAGASWQPVPGLNDHPTGAAWQPGAGGLCLHSLVFDPANDRRVWCGISAVGVFRSDDAGETWTPKNEGVPIIIEDESHKDVGFCVHALAPDPDDANRIWRQDHLGMFRTTDGGERWERIENGLSSGFGFPLAIDRATKTLFAVPLESDEYRVPPGGKLRVYRSRDGGDSWQACGAGLPDIGWTGVLRRAVAADQRDPGGVIFGTTSGSLHASRDLGDSWTTIEATLPRILFVEAID